MNFPYGFGKKASDNLLNLEEQLAQYKRTDVTKTAPVITYEKPIGDIGPAKPSQISSDSDESSDDEPDINNPYYVKKEKQETVQQKQETTDSGIPSSHEVKIQGHKKGITALDVDPRGYRMATGSNDYNVRLWDFQGMNKSMNSFRILEPYDGQPINRICFNKDGSMVLVCTMGSQSKIYDREGRDIAECVKGDMYISDLSNTRGHTAMVRDGQWNPVESNSFISCSLDSTVRIWDVNQKKIGVEQQIPHKSIIKCKSTNGKKTGCTSCCYTNDGKTIAVSCQDGSLQIYSSKSFFSRTENIHQNAHAPNNSATSMVFYNDNYRLLTRASDHTLKLWDLRYFKKHLNAWYNLENSELHTQVSLSPDEKYILTGTSVIKEGEYGTLLFFDSTTYDKVGQLSISEASVTRCLWHKELNQIFVGSNDRDVHVLCDPTKSSNKGALLCIQKQERKAREEDIDFAIDIRTPFALPDFKDENRNRKRKFEKIRKDASKSMKPEMPSLKTAGPGTVTQYIMLAHSKVEDQKEDAREALIKLDAEARANSDLVSSAYQLTQPVPVFDYTPQKVEEQELLSSIQKICSGCGLQICRCGKSLRSFGNPKSMFNQGES